MNAAEARTISANKGKRLANKQLGRAIKKLEVNIRDAVNKGLYKATVYVTHTDVWEIHSNSTKLKGLFRSKGFEIKVTKHLDILRFSCYWC